MVIIRLTIVKDDPEVLRTKKGRFLAGRHQTTEAVAQVRGQVGHLHHFGPALGALGEREGTLGEVEGPGQEIDEFPVGGALFRWGRQADLKAVAIEAHHLGALGPGTTVSRSRYPWPVG